MISRMLVPSTLLALLSLSLSERRSRPASAMSLKMWRLDRSDLDGIFDRTADQYVNCTSNCSADPTPLATTFACVVMVVWPYSTSTAIIIKPSPGSSVPFAPKSLPSSSMALVSKNKGVESPRAFRAKRLIRDGMSTQQIAAIEAREILLKYHDLEGSQQSSVSSI